jgi:hypothetical protein
MLIIYWWWCIQTVGIPNLLQVFQVLEIRNRFFKQHFQKINKNNVSYHEGLLALDWSKVSIILSSSKDILQENTKSSG